MATVKDWIKVLIASLTGTLITLVLTSMFSYPKNIENKFDAVDEHFIVIEKETNQNIEKVKQQSIDYTDKVMKKHNQEEQIEREQIKAQYTQIQSDLTIIKQHLISD